MADFPERRDEPDPDARVKAYRERAIEILRIAETLQETIPRTTLLITAQDYLRMADILEGATRAELPPAPASPQATKPHDCRR
jgi:hypothetical protein